MPSDVDLGLELGHVVVLGDVLRNLVVAAPVVVLGPGVELPVGDGELAFGVFDEDGAGVAEPDAVGGPVVEVEAGHIGSGALEQAGGAALGGEVVDEDVDVFAAGEVADDLGVDPGDGLELAGPVFGVVRPGDPGGGVRRPLGGHAVVLVAGCRRAGLHCPAWGPPLTKVCKVFDPMDLGPDFDCVGPVKSAIKWVAAKVFILKGNVELAFVPCFLSIAGGIELFCNVYLICLQ